MSELKNNWRDFFSDQPKSSTLPTFDFLSNPLLLIVYRIYILFALVYNVRMVDQMVSFDLEFKFQLLSLVILIFFSLSVGLYRVKLTKFIEKMEEKGKPFPFPKSDIPQFKRVVVGMIVFAFLIILYAIDAWEIMKSLWKSNSALGLNMVLLGSLMVSLFYAFQSPVDAMEQYVKRIVKLYRHYITSIFIGVGIILVYMLLGGEKEFPFLMFSYNLLILYNEVVMYKQKRKEKSDSLFNPPAQKPSNPAL